MSYTLNQIANEVNVFNLKRNWNKSHNPKNLAISISIESAELLEHFQWLTTEKSEQYILENNNKKMLSEELADIMIYCLCFANKLNINIEDEIISKLEKNNQKYPITDK